MRVIAYEPYPDAAFVRQNAIELMSLEQLFEEADYVSLHLPLSPESKGIIDRRYLRRMKPTAYLVNTARGPIVNEADLSRRCKAKKIAGAGLDVFEVEPPGRQPDDAARQRGTDGAHGRGRREVR